MALAQSKLNGSGVVRGLPFEYMLRLVALRWGVIPADLEARLGEPRVQQWVIRELEFMRAEAVEVKTGRG